MVGGARLRPWHASLRDTPRGSEPSGLRKRVRFRRVARGRGADQCRIQKFLGDFGLDAARRQNLADERVRRDDPQPAKDALDVAWSRRRARLDLVKGVALEEAT